MTWLDGITDSMDTGLGGFCKLALGEAGGSLTTEEAEAQRIWLRPIIPPASPPFLGKEGGEESTPVGAGGPRGKPVQSQVV